MQEGKEFNPYMKFFGLFVPNSIAMSSISDSSKLLLGRLMQFSGEDGKAYPTRKRLKKELCWSTRKLDYTIKNLKDLKLIKTVSKDPDNKQSPSEYRFLYHSMYKTPLVKSCSTPLTNPAAPPCQILQGYNRVSLIDEHNRESFSKEKEPEGTGRVEFNGLVCKICGENQFKTRSGDVCKNGHGGIEGVDPKDFKKPILHNLTRIGSVPLKKIQPSGLTLFNYSTEAKQILKCWKDYNGRLHINGNAKTAGLIQRMIDELLIEGRNPYISLTDDSELRFRKWTVKEICHCIIFYAGVDGLNKDIEDMYFYSFIIRRFGGFKGRNRKDHSPLIDSFKDEPKNSEWAKIIKKRFTSEFPKATVYPKSVQTITTFLENKLDDYTISDTGNNSFLPTMFFRYMKQKVEVAGNYDPIKYMASQSNLDNFISGLVKSFKAKKRTKEEKKKWLIDKPIMAENRRKAIEQKNKQLKREATI